MTDVEEKHRQDKYHYKSRFMGHVLEEQQRKEYEKEKKKIEAKAHIDK